MAHRLSGLLDFRNGVEHKKVELMTTVKLHADNTAWSWVLALFGTTAMGAGILLLLLQALIGERRFHSGELIVQRARQLLRSHFQLLLVQSGTGVRHSVDSSHRQVWRNYGDSSGRTVTFAGSKTSMSSSAVKKVAVVSRT